ncbi:hypothetical protein E4T52_09021 [Aureobasidium sp. EXF-3400]|nr:hypothetical protein E4T51_10759 [Aureobasidium sp. EXF-12344]KAI4776026.1 hypothetical protein E4T52_09021 [Aureobasidium sp. EXF-3400]
MDAKVLEEGGFMKLWLHIIQHFVFQTLRVMGGFTTILWDKRRWGFAVYRTDYSSEADWTKFLAMYETYSLHGLPSQELEDGRLTKSWHQPYWMKDKAQFEDATVEQLRRHFRSWICSQDLEGRLAWPESYMFMVVDKDVLERIRSLNPELDLLPWERKPFVKAIDKESPNEGEDYPGWMKVSLVSMFDVYQKGLDYENMRGLRSRHTDWYRGRIPEDETFLEALDESSSSLSWASGSDDYMNTSES